MSESGVERGQNQAGSLNQIVAGSAPDILRNIPSSFSPNSIRTWSRT
jgi:hypothetical protein